MGPDPARVAEFAERINAARSPVIVYGSDLARSQAWNEGIRFAETLGGRQETCDIKTELRHEPVRADGDGPTGDLGRHAKARCRVEALNGCKRDAPLLCSCDDRFSNRMLGAGLDRRNESQNFVVFEAFGGNEVCQFRASFGQCAGFIERDDAHITQRL